MTQRLNLFLIVVFTCHGCDRRNNDNLQRENDSLRVEIKALDSLVMRISDLSYALSDVKQSEQALNKELDKGISLENLKHRVQAMSEGVKKTQHRLSVVDKDLRTANLKSNSLLTMVSELQDELQTSILEVESLERVLVKYKSSNSGLIKRGSLQQNELATLQKELIAKQTELLRLHQQAEQMVTDLKLTEAEAYYARALSVEKAATRTRLAPRKKRDTYQEALELYKKALSLGKVESQSNIEALERKLKRK